MTDRDEILANFQACTRIADIEHCIAVLEQHDWDLNLAASSALEATFSSLPQSHSVDLDVVEDSVSIPVRSVEHRPTNQRQTARTTQTTHQRNAPHTSAAPEPFASWGILNDLKLNSTDHWPALANPSVSTTGAGVSDSRSLTAPGTSASPPSPPATTELECIVPSDDGEEDFRDVDLFEGEPVPLSAPMKSLMPDAAQDERAATDQFFRVFLERYCQDGDTAVPQFFIGTLQDAIDRTLNTRPQQRRPLFVYLHHDKSVGVNIFCQHILCSPEVVSYFTEHDCSLWPWDLTRPCNRAYLGTLFARHLSGIIVSQIRNFEPDSLPVLAVISKCQGTLELLRIIQGSRATKEDVLAQLWQVSTYFEECQLPEIEAELEWEARSLVRLEQDEAYMESLKKDQEKSRRQEEEQAERARVAAELETRRQNAANRVPAEPAEDCPTPVATLRFRLPSGEIRFRRFAAENTLGDLLAYTGSEGFFPTEYKLLTTYPRRDLTALSDLNSTMIDLKLVPQETLILEQK